MALLPLKYRILVTIGSLDVARLYQDLQKLFFFKYRLAFSHSRFSLFLFLTMNRGLFQIVGFPCNLGIGDAL